MKCVSVYPQYQEDARNIQFLSRDEHFAAHGGNWSNPTNGYYDPASKTMSDFGDGPPQPCAEVPLANPVYGAPLGSASTQPAFAGGNGVDVVAGSNARLKGLRRVGRALRDAWKKPIVRTVASALAVGVIGVAKEVVSGRFDHPSSGGDATPSTRQSVSPDLESDADPLREPRQSPDEHDVSGYTRADGTNVRPYRPGGTKD